MKTTGTLIRAASAAAVLALAAACGSGAAAQESPSQTALPEGVPDVGLTTAPTDPDCSGGYVGLTYDDGPSDWTWGVSTRLGDFNMHATFFMLGHKVQSYPGTVRKVKRDGNVIASHSWDHPHLTKIPLSKVHQEVERTSEAIEKATGKRPTLFRPPYGQTNPKVRQVVNEAGMLQVIWTHDSHDWESATTTPDQIRDSFSNIQAGQIVLMHDDYQSDMKAVPMIARVLAEKHMCTGRIVKSKTSVDIWQQSDGSMLTEKVKVVPW